MGTIAAPVARRDQMRSDLTDPRAVAVAGTRQAAVVALQRRAGNHIVGQVLRQGVRARADAGEPPAGVAAGCARALLRQEVPTAAATLETETLTSPRFAGEPLLEACFEDGARMTIGERDTDVNQPVSKVQQALVDLNFDLGTSGPNGDGVDGVYGPKTAAAVRKFKRDEHLGFEQFGDVGPGTMHRLNELFPAPAPPPPEPPPALPPELPPLEKKRGEPKESPPPTSERKAKPDEGASGKPGPPATKAPAKVVEINLAGSFVWDPPINDRQELVLFNAGKWHPATADFLKVMGANTNTGMGNFIGILVEIVKRPKGSVSRVNFMTHGAPKLLGISGRNTEDDVFFDESITDTDIEALLTPKDRKFKDQKNPRLEFTLDDVRARFTNDAIFVLYGCNSGSDPKLLTALHNLLGVKIIGFRSKIVFCPRPAKKGHFVRDGMKIGANKPGFKCPGDAVNKFRDLISDPAAVPNPP